MDDPLLIDPERTIALIHAYIRDHVSQSHAAGVLLGLSGGIDSALLASFVADAVGADAVHAMYLYDQHSSTSLRDCTRIVADQIGLKLTEESIAPAMRRRGLYATPGMRVTGLSRLINRGLHTLYCLISGETAFLSSLKSGSEKDRAGTPYKISLRGLIQQPEAGMNARHRYRRTVLEAQAVEKNLLLLGAANRSEWMVGWFVQGGVDDLPLQPLLGLYKSQVRQLALHLALPDCVFQHPPSPDMLPGITDEFAIGLSYAELDLILDHLSGGVSPGVLSNSGIRQRQINYVEDLMRWSSWKRRELSLPHAIDGGPTGLLRGLRSV